MFYKFQKKNSSTWLKCYSFSKIGFGILFVLFGLMFFQLGCKPKQVIVESEKVVYVTKDSIVNRDSTVYVPVEVYKDYSLFQDTLFLESSIAKAVAWNDTSNWMLNGYIENKQAIQYKYIEKLKVVRNDSIVELEKPIPYPVVEEKKVIPTFAIICICWTVITFVILLGLVYLKFIRP